MDGAVVWSPRMLRLLLCTRMEARFAVRKWSVVPPCQNVILVCHVDCSQRLYAGASVHLAHKQACLQAQETYTLHR